MKNFRIIPQNGHGNIKSPVSDSFENEDINDKLSLPDDSSQFAGSVSPRSNRVDISFTIQTGLYNIGYKRGIDSCDVKPNLERETKLLSTQAKVLR